MKNVIQTFILAVFCLLLAPTQSFGQLYEVSLDEKIEKSTLIVEGKVVETQTYKADDGTIYTSNKIELLGVLKGEYRSKDLYITTWGGEYEGELQTWTHLLILSKGDYGLFFLEPTQVPISKTTNADEVFDVYSASQGYVAFVQNDAKAWIGIEPFHTYEDIPKDLYGHIEKSVGQKMSVLNKGGDTKRSGIRYHFTDIDFDGTTITFVINVNSLVGEKKLYQSGIQFGYNPAFFGANIATNGNLQLQNVGISALNTYNLTKSNVSSSKVKIELLPSGSIGNIGGITVNEQLLAKGSISIQNFLTDPGIIYNLAEMQSMSKFYEGGMAQVFDTVVVDGDWRPSKLSPIISSIEPKVIPGGIDETITILGSNFGNYVEGESIVWFYNAKQGTNPLDIVEPLSGDYVYWDNNKITVQVPSYARILDQSDFLRDVIAGTGFIKVCSFGGECSTPNSDDLISVPFSITNDRTSTDEIPRNAGIPSVLRNANGGNAISIKFSDEFAADTDAKSSVLKAINTWKCITKVNWNTDENALPNDQTDMGLVYYDNLPLGTPSTIWAVTPNLIDKCKDNSTSDYIQAYQKNFKVGFNRNVPFWHKKQSLIGYNNDKIDMQSVALHEFGHAHNLNHVNTVSDVMYWAINQGFVKRILQPSDKDGGNWVMARSFSIIIGSDCPPPMYPSDNFGIDCSTVNSYYADKINSIFYPNPVYDNIYIQISSHDTKITLIEIFNLTGQKVVNYQVSENELQGLTQINLKELIAGNYLMRICTENNSFSTIKFIKQ
jgi:hypothetical protein